MYATMMKNKWRLHHSHTDTYTHRQKLMRGLKPKDQKVERIYVWWEMNDIRETMEDGKQIVFE